MQSLPSVFSNSLADSTDDLISTYMFSEQRKITDALINHKGDLSLLEEFANNFITQTLMGLTLYGYMFITMLIEKFIVRSGVEWLYITSGKLSKSIQNLKMKNLKAKNIKGKRAIAVLGAIVGSDKTRERIEIVKIANTNMDRIDKELQNSKTNKLAVEQKMLSVGATSAQIKGVSSQEDFNLYLHKLKTSTWNKTATDKKLFEKITGEKIANVSTVSWGDLVDNLNQLSEFAKDSENKIFNLTEAILKVINRANLAK